MSIQDTIEMLHKRASGEKPEPANSERELRLLALEMEKQAFISSALKAGLWEIPEAIGRFIGHGVKYPLWGAAAVGKKGLAGAANAGSTLLSRAAALPFDQPVLSLAGAGMAYDLASRMADMRRMGNVSSHVSVPRINQASRRY